MKSDIIIIGAGPGGYETALYAASQGLSVTIFEKDNVGGTCLNKGCIPTKTLCQTAEIIEKIKSAANFGISIQHQMVDFRKAVEHKDDVVVQLRAGIENLLLKNPLVTLVEGEATILSAATVLCNNEEYTCDNLIIATGSMPKFLNIEGAHHSGVLTSDEILDLDVLPKSLGIIGGGVIGMEFACIFSSLGVGVSVVEYCKEIVPNVDSDISKRLKQLLSRKGINITTGAAVQSISEAGTEMQISYLQKEKMNTISCEKILMAVGRTPRIPSGLDSIGVNTSPKGIIVNENMQSSIPCVYAIGDVNGICMLAHAAIFQGKRAVNAIINKPDGIDFKIIPAAVFTVPEAATVGLSETQCAELGINCKIVKSFYRANGKAVSMSETDGLVKLVIDADSKKILGAHILGAHASDLIHEIAALMNRGATSDECNMIIHAHPTLSEVVQSAFEQL